MTTTTCPRCAGTDGRHGLVHVRHGNGGGHNEPCPNAPTPDPYPEHTRQSAVLDQAQAIGQFLDESGYILAEYQQIDGYSEEVLMPVVTPVQQILAAYFGIDLSKIETEKRAMLAALAGA